MNCEGYLINKEGGREHLQVIDVSREGVKIRVPLRLQRGNSHVFTLFVGVNRKTELIGKVAWADKASGIAGVEVHSSDEVWRQLIDYLEKDYSVAA